MIGWNVSLRIATTRDTATRMASVNAMPVLVEEIAVFRCALAGRTRTLAMAMETVLTMASAAVLPVGVVAIVQSLSAMMIAQDKENAGRASVHAKLDMEEAIVKSKRALVIV